MSSSSSSRDAFKSWGRRFWPIAVCLIAILFMLPFGFDLDAAFEKFIPKDESAIAMTLVSKLAAKDFPAVEEQLNPQLKSPALRNQLETMANFFPAAAPLTSRVVGASTLSRNAATTYDLTIEYQYPQGWVLANVVLERAQGKLVVQGLHVAPRAMSLKEENRFTFKGKSAMHYVVFALAVVVPLFIVYTLYLCMRTPIAKRKWLWVIFVAIGVVQFHLNWTTGEWSLQPVAFSLFGAGYSKPGPVAPWLFTVAFPLGAIIFLFRRKSWRPAPQDGRPIAAAATQSSADSH